MEPVRSAGGGSGNSGTYTQEMTETLRFEEEIQSLMRDNLIHQRFECSPPAIAGSTSFTALLALHPNQAVELLHDLDPVQPPSIGTLHVTDTNVLDPPFVRDAKALTDLSRSRSRSRSRSTILSVFDESPEGSSAIPSNSDDDHPPNLKFEPRDADSKPQRSAKRKETEKFTKGKAPLKKGKWFSGDLNGGNLDGGNLDGGDKLPYVHVRARRGQATDSHSLAERARREKINARMKLLQELVPGCSKISGTALVLDEIINHVQSLQRQVEILSMRLAAVNPRIDFTGLDNILSTEMQCGRVAAAGSGPGWFDGAMRRNHQCEQQQPIWHVDLHHQHDMGGWERDGSQLHHSHHHDFISGSSSGSPPGNSLFRYDSAASAALPLSTASQLKSEM